MYRILFVCTGNICRSPMAEYLLKNLIKREYLKKLAEVESAGTHPRPHAARGARHPSLLPWQVHRY